MQTIPLKDATSDLPRLIREILADTQPRVLITDEGEQVVLMPLDEFNAWQETNYLLSSPTNGDRLRRSLADANSGRFAAQELDRE